MVEVPTVGEKFCCGVRKVTQVLLIQSSVCVLCFAAVRCIWPVEVSPNGKVFVL